MSDSQAEEYFRMGFELGYKQPDAEPGIPLDEPWMSYYRQGMDAGRQAQSGDVVPAGAGADSPNDYDGPAVGPDPGGESWDHYQRRLDEALEFVFHTHPPHIEQEPPTIEAGPGTL